MLAIPFERGRRRVRFTGAVVSELAEIRARLGWKHLLRGQFQHLLLVLVLMPGALYLVEPHLGGQFIGPMRHRQAAHGLVAVAVTHQVTAWLVWRLQLCFGLLSRLLGKWDLAVWGVVFFPFLGARVALLALVGLGDSGSLGLGRPVEVGMGVVLLLIAGYTLWSVLWGFGLVRAMGGDHFRERYRRMPLVETGIFRYSSNAMYTFGFGGLWGLGLLLGSPAALVLALFQHAYIWVHMYCTEQPDMEVLYGDRPEPSSQQLGGGGGCNSV